MNTIQIVPFKEVYASKVLKLMRSSSGIDHHTDYTLWQAAHFDPELFFIALDDNRIAGYLFGRNIKESALLWQIAVDTKDRGKGIGKKLVSALIFSAKKNDFRSIITTITPDNIASKVTISSAAKSSGFSMNEVGITSSFGGSMKKEIIYEIKLN
jgi:L-2,4-diaminobutyric acid acetyltransferase